MTPTPDDDARRLARRLGGGGPTVVARAPGRVNLVGEHTDYNGLPALPFAIEPAVRVAAAARADGMVEVANADARFTPCRFRIEAEIAPNGPGEWGNYVRAAAQALVSAGIAVPPGATLLVEGQIPIAAGVSSSSALVVACALAMAGLAGATPDPLHLAEVLAAGERYVGTLSGGMDQAAILLSTAGSALRLDFFPLRSRPVPMPADARFVVAHTLDEAAKSGAARGLYNQRVVECRLACAILAHRLGRPLAHLGALPAPLEVWAALDELLPECVDRSALGRHGLTPSEVARAIPDRTVLADPDRFVLRARVRHVLAEAARVESTERALEARDLRALGALLDASHASGAGDYGTSTPAADAIVTIGRAAGALGGRIMGAGFGGSVLLLATPDRIAAVLSGLDRGFYEPRGALPAPRLLVAPSRGAEVVRVDWQHRVC